MDNILKSQPDCPGDGNEDLMVNDLDLTDWQIFANWDGHIGGSSWYDFNFDGVTDWNDRELIVQHLGTYCSPHVP